MKIGNVEIGVKWLIVSVVAVVLIVMAAWSAPFVFSGAAEGDVVYVYPDMDRDAFSANIKAQLGDFGGRVATVLGVAGFDVERRVGAYRVEQGESPLHFARKIRNGQQSPVRFTFNNIRTREQFAERVADKFLMEASEMLNVLNDSAECAKYGLTPATIVSVLLPDSYEFYWNISAESMLQRFASYSNDFWNKDRKAKAKALGLTPDEVVTVASIAEEETAKRDERGKVGRLYINRLQNGMPLQADPTVKFAIGDFSIKRITVAMTKVDNPYNTYRYAGLPPGPIRLVEKTTIDAVLNSDASDYLYMCAKEDFSGYHNFAKSYNEHLTNAARYRKELDKRGIK
ncbi:MAG: endolytic transglycosylase MltG [Muribaculaceae bacterium]